MFINCKKNLAIRIDGDVQSIPAGYIGSIPDALAGHWMVQAAIKDGTIATPGGIADKDLERADAVAAGKADAADIRPDGAGEADAAGKPDGAGKVDAAGKPDGEKTSKK